MKENRLDAVLTRNRKHVVLDVALAAFFLMALIFSGLAFGSELPKLSMAPSAAPTDATRTADGRLVANAPCDAPAKLAAR